MVVIVAACFFCLLDLHFPLLFLIKSVSTQAMGYEAQ